MTSSFIPLLSKRTKALQHAATTLILSDKLNISSIVGKKYFLSPLEAQNYHNY